MEFLEGKMKDAEARLKEFRKDLKGLTSNCSSTGLPLPDNFDGKASFRDYLRDFNRIATAHGWTPARCAQILPLYLESEAKAAYDSLERIDRTNWQALLEALGQKFTKSNAKESSRRQLAVRRQLKNESLAEFGLAIKDLVRSAFPDDTFPRQNNQGLNIQQKAEAEVKFDRDVAKFRDDLAKDHFRNGLLPELKEKVFFMKQPDSFEEALQQAKMVEELHQTIHAETITSGGEVCALQDVRAEIAALREEMRMTSLEQAEPEEEWDFQQNCSYEEAATWTDWQGQQHQCFQPQQYQTHQPSPSGTEDSYDQPSTSATYYELRR